MSCCIVNSHHSGSCSFHQHECSPKPTLPHRRTLCMMMLHCPNTHVHPLLRCCEECKFYTLCTKTHFAILSVQANMPIEMLPHVHWVVSVLHNLMGVAYVECIRNIKKLQSDFWNVPISTYPPLSEVMLFCSSPTLANYLFHAPALPITSCRQLLTSSRRIWLWSSLQLTWWCSFPWWVALVVPTLGRSLFPFSSGTWIAIFLVLMQCDSFHLICLVLCGALLEVE